MAEVPEAAKPPEHMPKKAGWAPAPTILFTVAIYVLAQVAAAIVLAFYPIIAGLDKTETEAWLKTSPARFLAILFFGLATVAMINGLLKLKKQSLKDIGLKMPRLKDAGYALVGFMVYFAIYVAIAVLIKAMFPSLNFDQKQQIGFNVTSSGLQLFVIFVSLVIIPPIAEEILARGFLYTGLKSRLPIWAATVITSIMFASAHLQFGSGAPLLWVAAIDTFSLSLVLVYLREKTGGLAAPMMLHGLKNFLAFLFLFVFIH